MGYMLQLLDAYFAYKSPKYVEVRDWRLGLLHKAFQLTGLAYVFLWMMMYKCRHLKEIPVSGYARVDISTPVKDRCFEADARCELDLTSFADLPYCLQGKAKQTPEQKTCIYRDAYDLSPSTPIPNALFIPFYVNRMFQARGCNPEEENGWSCEQTYITKADENGEWEHGAFIADVERYRLLISHSYEAGNGAVQSEQVLLGRSQTTQGSLTPTFRGLRMGRIRHHLTQDGPADVEIPHDEGGNPDFPTLYHSAWGDELSISDLLKLADPRGADYVLSLKEENGLQRRERGGVLFVSIDYTNAAAFDVFGLTEPHYVMSARLLPLQWFYQSHALPHKTGGRHIEAYQGLMVKVAVRGNLRVFDWPRLLQVLVTSAVLLTLAGVLTDALMLHCTGLATHHNLIRRQAGPVASDLRTAISRLREAAGDEAPDSSEDAPVVREDLLTVLERIEQRLDGLDLADCRYERESASDVAGAHLEDFAKGLVGTARVAPL